MMTFTIQNLKKELKSLGNPEKAQKNARFFKTGKGQYGEGDVFIGVTMPEQRNLAKKFVGLSLTSLEALLQAPEHEFRMTALLILVQQFRKGDEKTQKNIYEFYLKNTAHINNWDLVDASAEHILGPWLEDQPHKMDTLSKLATSKNLWERRMAMLSTFYYIKNGNANEALEIAKILLHDQHDLIHKAVGWMLREIGKRCSIEVEEDFLQQYYLQMPRTMLRYAIEKFPEEKRQLYLKGKF